MAEERPSDLLGALPRTRPHRRSTKRPVKLDASQPPAATEPAESSPVSTASKPSKRPRTASGSAPKSRSAPPAKPSSPKRPARGKARSDTLRQPPQPRGIPASPRAPVPPAHHRPEIIGTAIQAVAELTEIGLSVTARALRRTLSRLPRP